MATRKKAASDDSGSINAKLVAALRHKHPALLPMGERDLAVRKVPTGIWTLDNALEGGIPMAKIIEIHGVSGSGKTSLCCGSPTSLPRANDRVSGCGVGS